jgi:hypothetical protein
MVNKASRKFYEADAHWVKFNMMRHFVQSFAAFQIHFGHYLLEANPCNKLPLIGRG